MARDPLSYYVVTWNCPNWERESMKSFETKRNALRWAKRLGLPCVVTYGHVSIGFVPVYFE